MCVDSCGFVVDAWGVDRPQHMEGHSNEIWRSQTGAGSGKSCISHQRVHIF